MKTKYDYLVIGSGIIGLTLAYALRRQTNASILIIDKEADVAAHASGRNSGVVHAGFYYTSNSLKARFTVSGNQQMKEYCRRKNLPLNECGKLVVAQNDEELSQLYELKERGQKNGSRVEIIEEAKARSLEPNIKTYKKALHSPDTASLDPQKVCQALKADLLSSGVDFGFDTRYLGKTPHGIRTSKGDYEVSRKTINAGGLYADKIAQDYGCGRCYTMIPFKGLYLKYTKNTDDVKMNIYPVPNRKNPFLGVHFTKTVTGDIKIGPTAIPAFWRENYDSALHFNGQEFLSIVASEARLFMTNSFGFRQMAFEEMKKYNRPYFIGLAKRLVQDIDPKGFTEFTSPGIRAQLLDKKTLQLVQDFLIEAGKDSVHILNAVSPGFTCAFPFSEFVVKNYII